MNTCSEKLVVANRVSQELPNLHPRPPALRVFDAGVGDGSVLSRVMRAMHDRYPNTPFYIVGKEISLEDVRLTLQKLADRFYEHPATVVVLTNLNYADAPWLAVKSMSAASSMIWHELRLQGNTAHRFEPQIAELEPFLGDAWKAGVNPKTGNPSFERPVVLVIYREDHRFLLEPILPRPGGIDRKLRPRDRVAALSRPRIARLQGQARDRAARPRARTRRPPDRHPVVRQRSGTGDRAEGLAGRQPVHPRPPQILKAVKQELGAGGRELNFNVYADNRALFRYDMHTLPSEVEGSIGTSTAFAAWNAAVYVAQVEDQRLDEAVSDGTLHRRYGGRSAEARRTVVLGRILRDLAAARVTTKHLSGG